MYVHAHVAFRWWRGESADVALACRLIYSHPIQDEPHIGIHWDPFPSPTLPSDATASYKSALVHVHIMLASLSTPQELEARGARCEVLDARGTD